MLRVQNRLCILNTTKFYKGNEVPILPRTGEGIGMIAFICCLQCLQLYKQTHKNGQIPTDFSQKRLIFTVDALARKNSNITRRRQLLVDFMVTTTTNLDESMALCSHIQVMTRLLSKRIPTTTSPLEKLV